MNICYLEDSGSSLKIQDFLTDNEHTVKTTPDFRDLAEWITFNYYDVLILDLIIHPRSLLFIPGCDKYEEEKHHSPTLYFLDHFLLVNFPLYKERIILLTAFYSDLCSKGYKSKMDEYKIVNKHGPKSMDNLIIYIDMIYKDIIKRK
jgi:hypothetical protein